VEKGGGFATVVYDKIFRIIDTDRNGSIYLKEWEIHCMAINIPVEHAKASFKAMDTDGDGVISHDEFVAYHYEYFHTSEDKLHIVLFCMDHCSKIINRHWNSKNFDNPP
jgi:hypothetical protein